MGRIAVVCINYNTDRESCEFVEGLYRLSGSDLVDVFVMDNSALLPEKVCFTELKKKYPLFKYISCPDNPGYFGAAQFFLNTQKQQIKDYDWVIVSNSDITIRDPQFFSKIRSHERPDVGVLAPAVVSLLSGCDTNPFMKVRPSKSRMKFYRWMFSNYLTSKCYHILALVKARILATKKTPPRRSRQIQDIYAPHGAFMIFSKFYFEKGGDFVHGPFLYGEEVTVGENCRNLALRVVYDPDVEVIHQERASTGIIYSRKVLRWKKESSHYLAKKYFR